MKTTRISLVGFLLSFSALNLPAPPAQAATSDSTSSATSPSTIEERLSKLTAQLRQREQQRPDVNQFDPDQLMAKGFADGDNRGWRRSNHSGWADGRHGGEFRNHNPWRDGWRDGHRFFDWPD